MYVALTRAKGRLYLPLVLKHGWPAEALRGAYDAVNRAARGARRAQDEPLVAMEDLPRVQASCRAVARHGAASPMAPAARAAARRARRAADLRALCASATRAAVVTSYTRMRGGAVGGALGVGRRARDRAARARRRDGGGRRAGDRRCARRALPASSCTRCSSASPWLVRVERLRAPGARARGRRGALRRGHRRRTGSIPRSASTPSSSCGRRTRRPSSLPGGGASQGFAAATRVVREMEFVYPSPAGIQPRRERASCAARVSTSPSSTTGSPTSWTGRRDSLPVLRRRGPGARTWTGTTRTRRSSTRSPSVKLLGVRSARGARGPLRRAALLLPARLRRGGRGHLVVAAELETTWRGRRGRAARSALAEGRRERARSVGTARSAARARVEAGRRSRAAPTRGTDPEGPSVRRARVPRLGDRAHGVGR